MAILYNKTDAIIASNKTIGDRTEMFHNPIIVTAILGRLLHHGIVPNIRGNSYRIKEKTAKELIDMTGTEG